MSFGSNYTRKAGLGEKIYDTQNIFSWIRLAHKQKKKKKETLYHGPYHFQQRFHFNNNNNNE